MKSVFKNSNGVLISLVLTDNGSPIDLTTKTVTLNLYSIGLNVLKWTHAATVDTAASGLAHYTTAATSDFDTVGDYYLNAVITGTGYSKTIMYDIYQVIENQQSLVTPAQLLEFMDIPTENAKSTNVIQIYIDQANTSLDLRVPSLISTTDQRMLQQKQRLIEIKAATLYFMNSGENNVNPEIRTQKIKLWTEEYKEVTNQLNNSLSNTSTTGNGAVRRVTFTSETSNASLSPGDVYDTS